MLACLLPRACIAAPMRPRRRPTRCLALRRACACAAAPVHPAPPVRHRRSLARLACSLAPGAAPPGGAGPVRRQRRHSAVPSPVLRCPGPRKRRERRKPCPALFRIGIFAFLGIFGTRRRLQCGHVPAPSAHSCGSTVQSPRGRPAAMGGSGGSSHPASARTPHARGVFKLFARVRAGVSRLPMSPVSKVATNYNVTRARVDLIPNLQHPGWHRPGAC